MKRRLGVASPARLDLVGYGKGVCMETQPRTPAQPWASPRLVELAASDTAQAGTVLLDPKDK